MSRSCSDSTVELTAEHLTLARRTVATRIRRAGMAHMRDEWESVAFEALAHAACTFDASHGTPFESWAAYKVSRALLDAHRNWFGRHTPKPGAGYAELADELGQQPEAEAGVDDVERTVLARDLLRYLSRLPDRPRAALVALVSGQPYAELAEAWGVTESRVSQLAADGRRELVRLAA